ncbi:hypothetical protein ACHAWF_003157 [Thalassiosira exigua]
MAAFMIQTSTFAIALAASISLNPSLPDAIAPSTSSWLSSTSFLQPTAAAATIPQPFPQYNTAKGIPLSFFKSNKVIRGRVVKVIDGDTIRIRHTPFYPLSKSKGGCIGRKLSECTISVRLYGVDAPETAKFGNPAQPYSDEATKYVFDRVYDRVVRVKLLRKDQYSRVVGKVTARRKFLPFLKKDLSEGLVERGYASLYIGGGADYDGRRTELEKKVKMAQDKKRGIWTNGVDSYADPADYKRALKKGRTDREK